MTDLVRFAHFVGSALWIGGALVAIMVATKAQAETAQVRVSVARLLTPVHTLVVGVGAILTVGTGIVWIMLLVQGNGPEASATPGGWVMQVAGLVGGALVLLVEVPSAVKLGGLAVSTDDGGVLPAFEYYQRRLLRVTSVGLVLAIVSLFAVVAF